MDSKAIHYAKLVESRQQRGARSHQGPDSHSGGRWPSPDSDDEVVWFFRRVLLSFMVLSSSDGDLSVRRILEPFSAL